MTSTPPLSRPTTALLLGVALLATACSPLTPVNAWDKGHLAKPAMGFESNPLDAKLVEHTYASREAASGGASVGGGGCGCN